MKVGTTKTIDVLKNVEVMGLDASWDLRLGAFNAIAAGDGCSPKRW